MAQYPEKEQIFKSALRQQILGRSHLIQKELAKGTRFIYSEEYPTQVLNTTLGRFIRINCSDIDEDNISNVLKLMMGIDSYYTIPEHTITNDDGIEEVVPEETQNISDVLTQAINKVKSTDFIDLGTFDPELSDEYGEDYEPESDEVVKYDSFGNPVETIFNLVPQLVYLKPDVTDHEEFDPSKLEFSEDIPAMISGDSDLTSEASSLASVMGDKDSASSPDSKSDTVNIEQALNDLPQFYNVSKFHSNTSILTKQDLLKLQPKVKQLLKAFQGKGNQIKIVTPTKRMSSKDIATDRDKCYIRKTGDKGKHINLNFLIDMSGSMGGSPVKNAVKLVYLFNQLAKEGYVKMSVLYSTTNTNYRLDLPATDAEILALNKVQSAEGLAKTIHAHADVIRGVNTICLTDGDIVDEAIDKGFWAKHRSISTGIYVNSSLTSYTEYTGKLNKWFNHSIVRKSLDELIEWLIRTGLKG